MRKRILILFCGGTIAMVKDKDGSLVPPKKETAIASIFNLAPGIEELVDLEVQFIINIDSSNMTSLIWDQMAEVIYQNYDFYDGFVLTHGTDTMAYTSSALSFALQNIGKPVVLTGAQIPGNRLESDARRNFCNAIRVATQDLSGVFIVFGDQILLGSRASKISHSKLDAFASINMPPLGEVGVNIRLHQKLSRKNLPMTLQKGFNSDIAVVSLVPGMPVRLVEKLVDEGLRGLILVAYGTGNVPDVYLPLLQKAQDKQVAVVIRTQCLEGSTNIHAYETGKRALEFKAIQAYDMSLESTITKLMWVLYREIPYLHIREWIHENLAGEIQVT